MFLRLKPLPGIKAAKKALKKATDDVWEIIDDLEGLAIEKGLDMAQAKAEKLGARVGAKHLGALVVWQLLPG